MQNFTNFFVYQQCTGMTQYVTKRDHSHVISKYNPYTFFFVIQKRPVQQHH